MIWYVPQGIYYKWSWSSFLFTLPLNHQAGLHNKLGCGTHLENGLCKNRCSVGSINLKRCLCLAIRNRVFGEYNSNPEGFCSSTSGTCAAVSSKMTPFSPYNFSRFFRFLENQPDEWVLNQLRIQIFNMLEPTWPAWMGRFSFRVRPFLGHVTASRTILYQPFLLTKRRKVDF